MKLRHFLVFSLGIAVSSAVSSLAQSAPPVTSHQIGTAALALAKDFGASDAAASHPVVRVAPVENDTDLPLRCDKTTTLIRSALASDGSVTVAADGATNVDALFSSRLKREGDGYAFSGSAVALGTGDILWRGSAPVNTDDVSAPQTATTPASSLPEMPSAEPAVPAAIPVGMPMALPVALPTTSSTSSMSPAPAATAAVPVPAMTVPGLTEPGLGQTPEPEFAEGAARTWDEWFSRGIKSCGYHRAGEEPSSRRTASSSGPRTSEPRTKGYLGHPYFRVQGLYGFHNEHDFHDCTHGKGGGGSAGASFDIRFPVNLFTKDVDIQSEMVEWLSEHSDLRLGAWWRKAVLLPDEVEGLRNIDLDGEYWGCWANVQISLSPGETINPYVGFGLDYNRLEEKARARVRVYDYAWYRGYYWYDVDVDVEESESSTSPMFTLGLELNLNSRLSLRGDWTYYGDGGWNEDKEDYSDSRQIISADLNFRLFSETFLSLSGSYERKEHQKTIGAGFGYLF